MSRRAKPEATIARLRRRHESMRGRWLEEMPFIVLVGAVARYRDFGGSFVAWVQLLDAENERRANAIRAAGGGCKCDEPTAICKPRGSAR